MSRMKVDLDKIAEGISKSDGRKSKKSKKDKEKPDEGVQSENSVLLDQQTTTVLQGTEPQKPAHVDWNDQLRQWQKNPSINEFKRVLEAKGDIRKGFGHLALALRGLVTCTSENREKMWTHLMTRETDRMKFQIVYNECIGADGAELDSASLDSIASVLERNGVETSEVKIGKPFETRLFEAITSFMNCLKHNHGKLHAPRSEFASYCADQLLYDFVYNLPDVNDEGHSNIVVNEILTRLGQSNVQAHQMIKTFLQEVMAKGGKTPKSKPVNFLLEALSEYNKSRTRCLDQFLETYSESENIAIRRLLNDKKALQVAIHGPNSTKLNNNGGDSIKMTLIDDLKPTNEKKGKKIKPVKAARSSVKNPKTDRPQLEITECRICGNRHKGIGPKVCMFAKCEHPDRNLEYKVKAWSESAAGIAAKAKNFDALPWKKTIQGADFDMKPVTSGKLNNNFLFAIAESKKETLIKIPVRSKKGHKINIEVKTRIIDTGALNSDYISKSLANRLKRFYNFTIHP